MDGKQVQKLISRAKKVAVWVKPPWNDGWYVYTTPPTKEMVEKYIDRSLDDSSFEYTAHLSLETLYIDNITTKLCPPSKNL